MAAPDYISYVDRYKDLTKAWGKITGYKSSAEYKYWHPMGATTKSEFGRLHWTTYGKDAEKRTLVPEMDKAREKVDDSPKKEIETPTISPPTYEISRPVSPVNEVMYARNAVSGLPRLTGPPKMSSPAQRTAHPQELVEYRMSKMMRRSNPYTAAAVTQAKQWANQSGMLNTSIASSAGIDAAIKNILPIAQQDAATLSTQALTNQRVVNEFLMQDYLTKSQFKLTEYGHMANTYNQGLQQAHNKNESALTRAWQTEQARLDRELTVWRDQFASESQMDLAGVGCQQNAMDRWAATVAAIESEKSNLSTELYNSRIKNAARARDHQISMCPAGG